jgi:hypothetical protein
MSDVIQNIKSGFTNNGSAIVGVNAFGDYDKIDTDEIVNVAGLENKYTNRFGEDDVLLPESQYQWDDMRIIPSTFDFAGANDPSITTWTPGGAGAVSFRIWEFQQNDTGYFSCQIPHGYAEGTDLLPHIHWTPKDRGVAESGKTVDWKLDYSIASINEVFPSSVTLSMKDTCSGENHKHEIDAATPTISGSGLRVSAMLVGRIYRGADDTWAGTSAGQLPCLLELDIHYQINSLGSRTERVK